MLHVFTDSPFLSRAARVSWAMYEFARAPFVLLITVYIFAPYFVRTLSADPVKGQALWGDIQGASGIIIALCAPFAGATADAGGHRKPWLAALTALLMLCMALLWYAKPDGSAFSLLETGALVAAASVCYELSAVFYNALLPGVAAPSRMGMLSGWALALGNLAGLILLIAMLVCFSLPGHVHWAMVPAHPLFGIDPAQHEPERLSGPLCALWLLIFSPLLFLFTPDRQANKTDTPHAFAAGISSVLHTLRSLQHYRNVATYLAARLLFNDGMTALLVFAGIYVSGIFHWGTLALAAFGIVLSIFAMFGGLFGGWLDGRLGSKLALIVSVGGTALLGLASITIGPDRILWIIPYDPHSPTINHLPFFRTLPEVLTLGIFALTAALVAASYANARTMMARIAPLSQMTEFFGLFALSGQSTTFLATLSVSLLTSWSHSQRGGFFAVLVFLIAGLAGLIWVKEERAEAL